MRSHTSFVLVLPARRQGGGGLDSSPTNQFDGKGVDDSEENSYCIQDSAHTVLIIQKIKDVEE